MSEKNTITNLIDDLAQNYQQMKEGTMDLQLGKELSNVAGKMIKAASLKSERDKYLKKTDTIPFLDN